MIKNHLKSLVTIAMLLSAIFMFAPTTAQARSFGGGHSFHTSPHVASPHVASPHTGGGHSFHTSPRVKSPSLGGGHSFHTPKSPSRDGGKSYQTPSRKGRIYKSPRVAAPSTNPNHPSKAPGLFSGFGRAIVQGAGWSIGSTMGNSLWHTMFGFGGNQYVGANGQTQYQSGGHSGWIIIIIIAVIAFILFRFYRNRQK